MDKLELEIRLGVHRQILALLVARLPKSISDEMMAMYAGADEAETTGAAPRAASIFRAEVDEILIAARKLAPLKR